MVCLRNICINTLHKGDDDDDYDDNNNNNNNNNNPDSNIIYGNNSKVAITKSKNTWLAPEYVYTNAKICNSRHMFNCKKLSKL